MSCARAILVVLFVLFVGAHVAPAQAGTRCELLKPTPEKVEAAAATALRTLHALDAVDAPVALVARVGTDLSKHGLVYSHAGFAVRDHADGRWTVVHLLNQCDSASSGLYTQGLVDFFSDDLVNQDARIVWLRGDVAERLATRLQAPPHKLLHEPAYNLIARPGSEDYQNSTAWVLEMFASAVPEVGRLDDRVQAYEFARRDGFVADTVHIAYSKRVLGGLFSSNTVFTDHSVGTRLSGAYPVVTVRAILRYLDARGYAVQVQEWRNGRLQAVPGPG